MITKSEHDWRRFQDIAGLHIVWRHPLVRAARMSCPAGQALQHAVQNDSATLDLLALDGKQDAQLAHQPRTGDAHRGQGVALAGARPGPVEADAQSGVAGGFVGAHGRTIPVRLAKAI